MNNSKFLRRLPAPIPTCYPGANLNIILYLFDQQDPGALDVMTNLSDLIDQMSVVRMRANITNAIAWMKVIKHCALLCAEIRFCRG